jgi:hypothetical protein
MAVLWAFPPRLFAVNSNTIRRVPSFAVNVFVETISKELGSFRLDLTSSAHVFICSGSWLFRTPHPASSIADITIVVKMGKMFIAAINVFSF